MKPTIIVAESSKLFNVIRYLSPRTIFRPDLTEEDLDAFLGGNFIMAFLQQLVIVGITRRKWKDYEMPADDYLHIVGLPVVQAYGPFARHVALYIPKMDPYAPYRIPSLSNYMIKVDRYVRLMIELTNDIVQEAAPIPFTEIREDCLKQVRYRILQEASRIGLLAKLNTAKAELSVANAGFIGARNAAARARTDQEIADGTREDYTVQG